MNGVCRGWRESLDHYRSKLEVYKGIKGELGVEKYLRLNLDKYEKSQVRYGILPWKLVGLIMSQGKVEFVLFVTHKLLKLLNILYLNVLVIMHLHL